MRKQQSYLRSKNNNVRFTQIRVRNVSTCTYNRSLCINWNL